LRAGKFYSDSSSVQACFRQSISIRERMASHPVGMPPISSTRPSNLILILSLADCTLNPFV
jgi:hypothetical protein